jgi:hypothetical protein
MDEKSKRDKIMTFIYNSLENGWEVKKKDETSYIFKKPIDNVEEVYHENYLLHFIQKNFESN